VSIARDLRGPVPPRLAVSLPVRSNVSYKGSAGVTLPASSATLIARMRMRSLSGKVNVVTQNRVLAIARTQNKVKRTSKIGFVLPLCKQGSPVRSPPRPPFLTFKAAANPRSLASPPHCRFPLPRLLQD